MHDNASSHCTTSPQFIDEVERLLHSSLCAVVQEPERSAHQPGRPREFSSQSLWMALLSALLRQKDSQRAVWRTLACGGGAQGALVEVTDQAVYNRLDREGSEPLQHLFGQVSTLLTHWLEPAVQAQHEREGVLAPFARHVVAIDETYLDPLRRHLPVHQHIRRGHPALLPGKLSAVYDVRRHLWRSIHFIEDVDDQTRTHAYEALGGLEPGALILADLGYFGFQWFDHLTDQGFSWISRWREETSSYVIHTHYQDGETLDQIIWLGIWQERAKHAVRLIQFRQGAVLYRYLTNVCNPKILPMQEVARLYAHRWDIERAFFVLKRFVGLHLIWSGKTNVMLAQIWACLILAQILHALQVEVAFQAGVAVDEVSIKLLIECWQEWARFRPNGLQACVQHGRRLGIIRASQRYTPQTPQIDPHRLRPVPSHLNMMRLAHYSEPVQARTQESIEAVKTLRARSQALKDEKEEQQRRKKQVQATLKRWEQEKQKEKAQQKSESQRCKRQAVLEAHLRRAEQETTDPLPPGLQAPDWDALKPWRCES